MLDAICALFRRFDMDVQEGNYFPRRWVSWGRLISSQKNKPGYRRYFFIRLPSWDWQPVWECGPDVWAWHQRTLLWRDGKWELAFFRALD